LIEKFCNNPFERVHISMNGNVYVCCSGWTNGFSIGNAFRENFNEIWNSEAAQEIRKTVLDGSFKYCNAKKCPRMVANRLFDKTIIEQYKSIIKNEKILMDKGPKHFSLNYDNTCNIYCPSCRDHITKLSPEEIRKRIEFQNSLLNTKYINNARRITVSGVGDCLSSNVYKDLFDKINEERFPNLKIILRTNGLLLNSNTWERLKNVHYAIDRISISIDAATEDTYEKLRRGGRFSQLLKNLEFISGIKETNQIRVKLNFVVQKENYREMKDFVVMAKKFNFNRVAFNKLFKFSIHEIEKFNKAAIHSIEHPEHEVFKEMLKDPIFKDPIVDFRNLSNFLER